MLKINRALIPASRKTTLRVTEVHWIVADKLFQLLAERHYPRAHDRDLARGESCRKLLDQRAPQPQGRVIGRSGASGQDDELRATVMRVRFERDDRRADR
ncbi:hypothetical protein [Mesorhizobium silamurunense]|uniref:hypothetical protein n=1 Tax=Mesorhizobium silamurunense TaxID=499528 RepID=UPI001780E145|nr:hypothetical protein [Mesorhizobium silamurunense]